MILFWQFAIKTCEELDIVSNQNLALEMFLIRLIHISSTKSFKEDEISEKMKSLDNSDKISESKNEAVSQIKNITQEKKIKSEKQSEIKGYKNLSINSLESLIIACVQNKEVKLKYELEKNVNLVSFEKNRIEISFNDKLDKNFVKDLSLKLFEWTNQRWIISFSKIKGDMSIKEKETQKKNELLKDAQNTDTYKNMIQKFPDANLDHVTIKNKEEK